MVRMRFKRKKKYFKVLKVTKPPLRVRIGHAVRSTKAKFRRGFQQYQRETQELAKYGDRIVQSVPLATEPPKKLVKTLLTEEALLTKTEKVGKDLGLGQMSKEADEFVKEVAGFRRKKR